MRDFPKFFQHIKSLGYSPDVCIDVGAGYGTGSIYSAFPDAHHIVFEPIESNLSKLQDRLSKLSHEIHICALMNEPGEMALTVLGKDNLGSTLMNRDKSRSSEVVTVPVHRLDKFKSSIPQDSRVLLKTDCQGADLDVLKGAYEVLKVTDLVIVEASLFSFWGDHHPTLLKLAQYMESKGFEIYDILELAYRPLDNALGQVDIVFAKKEGALRSSNAWGKSNYKEPKKSETVLENDFQRLLDQKNSEISHLRALNSKVKEKEKMISHLKTLNEKSKEKDKLISHLRNLINANAKQESILFELKKGLTNI